MFNLDFIIMRMTVYITSEEVMQKSLNVNDRKVFLIGVLYWYISQFFLKVVSHEFHFSPCFQLWKDTSCLYNFTTRHLKWFPKN